MSIPSYLPLVMFRYSNGAYGDLCPHYQLAARFDRAQKIVLNVGVEVMPAVFSPSPRELTAEILYE